MKGIILAGGLGTRLHPLTLSTNKHLLMVHTQRMIHFPLSTLLSSGINEILIVSNVSDLPEFRLLLGDGSAFGARFTYAEQRVPNGIAQALLIGEAFIGEDSVCLILGDNLIDVPEMNTAIRSHARLEGAVIFAKTVKDPERFGVVELNYAGKPISLDEKPIKPRSAYAVPGLYLYDATAVRRAKALRPSLRGEYEITDLNRTYLEDGSLRVVSLPDTTFWMDMGTHESLQAAADYVRSAQLSSGRKIGCIQQAAVDGGLTVKQSSR